MSSIRTGPHLTAVWAERVWVDGGIPSSMLDLWSMWWCEGGEDETGGIRNWSTFCDEDPAACIAWRIIWVWERVRPRRRGSETLRGKENTSHNLNSCVFLSIHNFAEWTTLTIALSAWCNIQYFLHTQHKVKSILSKKLHSDRHLSMYTIINASNCANMS